MAKPRFNFKTKGLRGKYYQIIIEDHGKNGFMAQLTQHPMIPDPNDLHSETILLDHFQTLEEACKAVNYPYDLVGLPTLI